MIPRILLVVLGLQPLISKSQDSLALYEKSLLVSKKLFTTLEKKSNKLTRRINQFSLREVSKLERIERRFAEKLVQADSVSAKRSLDEIKAHYGNIRRLINSGANLSQVYSGRIDSLNTIIKFISSNYKWQEDLHIESVKRLLDSDQDALNRIFAVQEQLDARYKSLLRKIIGSRFPGRFNMYKSQYYAYQSKIAENMRLLNEPGRIEQELVCRISGIPAFQKFFAAHSQLSSLFHLPGSPVAEISVGDMQIRALLSANISQRLGLDNSAAALGNTISTARQQLNEISSKFNGSFGSDDPSMPGYRKDDSRSKSFFRRLQVGINIQSVKSNRFFPATTDFGVSVGYQLRSTVSFGVGGSYKMGWGSGFSHISLSHQGISFRSFIDCKMKGSFWISGGCEYNHNPGFKSIEELRYVNSWQASALIGAMKKVQLKQRKAELKLLYDFLHNKHPLKSEPLIFRIGYYLK